MGSTYSRLSKTKKRIFFSTVACLIVCMTFAVLIIEDIIVVNYATPYIQEDLKKNIINALIVIGLVPLLTFFIIVSKRKKVKRRAFSKETKEKVLRSQNYLCNDCGKSAQNWDFDHIGSRGDNSIPNCQALCLDCHREKTKREARQSKK